MKLSPVGLIEAARRASTRAVNALMTATYWGIGRRIVEQEQHGVARAGYGEELIVRLSDDLRKRFGRGFGRANLFQMRAFYLAYREILARSRQRSRRRSTSSRSGGRRQAKERSAGRRETRPSQRIEQVTLKYDFFELAP